MSLDPALYPPIPPVTGDAPRPVWSVIVPAYKAKYLAQSLHSVVNQAPSEDRMEILVMDDCSPEALEPIVKRVGGPRVKYTRQPANLGTYGNENSGIALSRGHWIHILNDDDWVLPGFYEVFEKSLERAPESVGAASCACTHFDMNGRQISTTSPLRGSPGVLVDFIEQLGISNKLHPIAAVFRRSCFERLGGFNLSLNYCSDWEFNKRVAMHYDWWYEPRVMAGYRVSPGNVSTQSVVTGQQLRDLRHAIELTARLLPDDRRDRISQASRDHYALYAFRVAEKALKNRQVPMALCQIQEGLKLSRAANVLDQLIKLLAIPAALPLRAQLAEFFDRLELPSDPS